MAEGRTFDVLCRYFLHGACREGSHCQFSHDRERGQPENICRFYLRGCCTYGDQCRYDHIKPRTNQNNKQSYSENSSRRNVESSSSESRLINGNSNGFKTPRKSSTGNSPLGHMTVLRKQGQSSSSESEDSFRPLKSNLRENAPEFIPWAPKTYANAVSVSSTKDIIDCNKEFAGLCAFAMMKDCPWGDQCEYAHCDLCDLCGYYCLHPTDEVQRKKHRQECMEFHEREMEESFAVARSKDKTCGICMDIIWEKMPPSERRFGILPNCVHVFCLCCIRKWRSAKQYENKLVRSCPECRVTSDFIIPNKYWVESKEDKDKLIADYRKALSTKPCKYFNQGQGDCPFAGNCFYLHAYPDGRKAELPPPRPRKRHNANGDIDLMQSVLLWDIFEDSYNHWYLQFELDDTSDLFTDSEDNSDWSDFDVQD